MLCVYINRMLRSRIVPGRPMSNFIADVGLVNGSVAKNQPPGEWENSLQFRPLHTRLACKNLSQIV